MEGQIRTSPRGSRENRESFKMRKFYPLTYFFSVKEIKTVIRVFQRHTLEQMEKQWYLRF